VVDIRRLGKPGDFDVLLASLWSMISSPLFRIRTKHTSQQLVLHPPCKPGALCRAIRAATRSRAHPSVSRRLPYN
jgi:hypothetical protein